MATSLTNEMPSPTGVFARYFGSTGGSTTYVYWIQAVYFNGRSTLGQSNTLSSCSGPDHNNKILVEWNSMAGAIAYNVYRTTTTTPPTGNLAATTYLVTLSSNTGWTDDGTYTISAGFVVPDGARRAYAHYDFAVDGGAVGLITLATSDTIPQYAVVTGSFVNSTTALTSGGSSTIAIGTSAGSSTTSLLGATAVASYSLDAVQSIAATKFKMSAAGTITMTIATATVTAGVADIVVAYDMPIGI